MFSLSFLPRTHSESSDSCIDPTNFRLLGEDICAKYVRFFALEMAESEKVVWCPHDGCGHGILCDDNNNEDKGKAREKEKDDKDSEKEKEMEKAQVKAIAKKRRGQLGLSFFFGKRNKKGKHVGQQAGNSDNAQDEDPELSTSSKVVECPACHRDLCLHCGHGHSTEQTCEDAVKEVLQYDSDCDSDNDVCFTGRRKGCRQNGKTDVRRSE